MGRTSRRSQVSAHSGEGRQIGLDDRELPGGLPHTGNAETHPDKVHVPAHVTIPSINEHRVPDNDPDAPYDTPQAGKVVIPEPAPQHPEKYAVPTYNVGHPGKVPQHLMSLCDTIQVPGNSSDPMRICAADYSRHEVHLLNEDAANDVRFSDDRTALIDGRGAVLKHGAVSYTRLRTQDWLWAVGTTDNPVVISVILTTEVNN